MKALLRRTRVVEETLVINVHLKCKRLLRERFQKKKVS